MSNNVIFLILIIISTTIQLKYCAAQSFTFPATESNENDKKLPCGPYGFRCLDKTSYQPCSSFLDMIDSQEPVYECSPGLVCDEDNMAFCSVDEYYSTTTEKSGRREHVDMSHLTNGDSYEYYYDEPFYNGEELVRDVRNPISFEEETCECEQTTTEESTTELTTETQPNESTTERQPFDCNAYGFFPETGNKTTFWFCDIGGKNGFSLHHMICGAQRVFDPFHRICLLPGTTRDEDDADLTRTILKKETRRCESKQPQSSSPKQFTCDGKKPGKYPDEDDCQSYHYCLSENFLPIKEALFLCPKDTAFDVKENCCTAAAFIACSQKLAGKTDHANRGTNQSSSKPITRSLNGVNCIKPSRFRECGDCGKFYICYGNRITEMKCPESYRFDDETLECLPKEVASCTES